MGIQVVVIIIGVIVYSVILVMIIRAGNDTKQRNEDLYINNQLLIEIAKKLGVEDTDIKKITEKQPAKEIGIDPRDQAVLPD